MRMTIVKTIILNTKKRDMLQIITYPPGCSLAVEDVSSLNKSENNVFSCFDKGKDDLFAELRHMRTSFVEDHSLQSGQPKLPYKSRQHYL